MPSVSLIILRGGSPVFLGLCRSAPARRAIAVLWFMCQKKRRGYCQSGLVTSTLMPPCVYGRARRPLDLRR
eukprot:3519482-Pyramimonas_sp.AAC.1